MPHTSQISGLSLYAVLDSLNNEDVINSLLLKKVNLNIAELKGGEHWFSLREWSEIVREARSLDGSEQTAIFSSGKRCSELGILGPVDYLPWFLSTPVLAVRNLSVILSGIDRIVIPEVEYLGPQSCAIQLRTRFEALVPEEYTEFLTGYLRCLIGLWPEAKIFDIRRERCSGDNSWLVTFDWNLEECRERRALEELLLQPDFFYDIFEGFRKISPGDRERRASLLKSHALLRNFENTAFKNYHDLKTESYRLRDELARLTTTPFDGKVLADSSGNIISLDKTAIKILGYSGQEAFLRRYPTIDDLFEIGGYPRDLPLKQQISETFGSEFLIEVERENGNKEKKLFTLPASKRAKNEGDLLLVLREKIFHSHNYHELGKDHLFLESILANNPVGILILNHNGRIVQINPQLEKMLNQESRVVTGNSSYLPINDPVLKGAGLDDDLRQAFSGKLVERSSVNLFMEERGRSLLVQNLKQPLVVNIKMYPLTDRAGNIFNVVISFIDITESFLLNRHLSQLDKMQSIATLASGVAHDFNNILGAIVPNADFIEQMAEGQLHIQKKANTIKQAAKRAASLTQQLLSYSRESKVVRQDLSVHSCINEAVNLISNAIPKTISIFYEPCVDDLVVSADPMQMQQVLINLLINASDASPKGGNITVKVSKAVLDHKVTFGGNIIEPGVFVCLSVIDQGTGMETELFDKVFNPFFTTKDKGRGTGLGLSVVHGIVKAHRGYVEISSRLGTGTRFDVHFPLGE